MDKPASPRPTGKNSQKVFSNSQKVFCVVTFYSVSDYDTHFSEFLLAGVAYGGKCRLFLKRFLGVGA
jgi:hypothetical protein